MDAVFNDLTFPPGGACPPPALEGFCGLLAQLQQKFQIRRVQCDRAGAMWLFGCTLPVQEAALRTQMGGKLFRRLQDVVYKFLKPLPMSCVGGALVFDNLHQSAPPAVEHAIAKGLLLVGLNSAVPWDQLVHPAQHGTCPYEIMCVTLAKHLDSPVFLRWGFAMEMLPFERIRGKLVTCDHKHFKWQSGNAPADWIAQTIDMAAQFNPEMQEYGAEVQHILKKVFRAAMLAGRLTCFSLHLFKQNLNRTIGASNGLATTWVELYITPQDVFHIRPV